jgi:hypothetical protein
VRAVVYCGAGKRKKRNVDIYKKANTGLKMANARASTDSRSSQLPPCLHMHEAMHHQKLTTKHKTKKIRAVYRSNAMGKRSDFL